MKKAVGNQLLLDVWADYTTQEEAAQQAKGMHCARNQK